MGSSYIISPSDEWLVDPIYWQWGNQTGTQGHGGTYNIYGQRAETIIIYNHICYIYIYMLKLFAFRQGVVSWKSATFHMTCCCYWKTCCPMGEALPFQPFWQHTGVEGSTPFRSGLFVVLLWFIHLLFFFFFFFFVFFVFFFSSFCSASSSPPCSKKCGESKARRSWRD